MTAGATCASRTAGGGPGPANTAGTTISSATAETLYGIVCRDGSSTISVNRENTTSTTISTGAASTALASIT